MVAAKADVPVVRGDMPDTWIHGPMSDPLGAKTARNARLLIAATDSLNTQLRTWGIATKDIRSTIADAYEQSLLYGEHTWGGATQNPDWGGGIRYGEEWKKLHAEGLWDRLEASWAAHSDYIHTAEKLVAPILAEDLNALAGAVNVAGRRVVVFNPLPWKRDGIVAFSNAGAAFGAVRDVETKAVAPVEANGDQLRFLARDVPPLGYRTYVPVEAQAAAPRATVDAQAAMMENDFFKVCLDPTKGVVVSLTDKRTGQEMVDSTAPHALGQYLYERFDADQAEKYVADYAYGKIPDPGSRGGACVCFGKPNMPPASQEPYCAASPQEFNLRFEQTPVAAVAVLDAAAGHGIPQPLTIRYVLYHDQPFLDIEVTLHDKPLDPWPEAGWLCLPLKVDQPAFKLGRLGAVTDLKRDTVAGSNRDVLCLNHGLALVDPQGAGAGVYTMDSPLVSFERPGLYRYSADFMPEKPWTYVNLFNNTWSTNFRDWLGGTWTSRVRLWAFGRYEAEPALVTPALESRCPLLATTTDAAPGSQPAVQTGLAISEKGVLVTAFGPNPDGSGTVLRLWEQAGRSGTCTVRFPTGMNVSSVQPVDLRGRPKGTPLPVFNDAFSTPLNAFAPVSFVIE
jgi:alpha-mannosidase